MTSGSSSALETQVCISLLCGEFAYFTWHHTTPASSAAFETSDSAAGRKLSCKYGELIACTFLYRSEQLLLLLLFPLHELEVHQHLFVLMCITCPVHVKALCGAQNGIKLSGTVGKSTQRTIYKPVTECVVKTQKSNTY